MERNVAVAFDGFRNNDWTRGPVTVHLLDLGMPEACVYTLVLGRRGACAVQTRRPRNACSDPKLRALCFHVCVKTDGAESRVLPRTYNDIGAESRLRPSPGRHGLISGVPIFWGSAIVCAPLSRRLRQRLPHRRHQARSEPAPASTGCSRLIGARGGADCLPFRTSRSDREDDSTIRYVQDSLVQQISYHYPILD